MMPSEHWASYQPTEDLENFRNNGGSAGLDGDSKVGKVNTKEDGMEGFYYILKDITGDFLDKIWFNEVGNPEGPEIDNRIITRSDIQNAYNMWRLYPYLEDGMKIVEIGPGFGGLASMIKRLFKVDYTLVDLPQQREIQRYYLSETVGLEGVNWSEPEDLTEADFVINIRSMMEMNQEQVRGYFKIIDKLNPEYFYCVNRYIKRTVLKEYPFEDKWEAVISTPLLFEPCIHEFLLKPGKGIKRLLQGLPPYQVDNLTIYPPVKMQDFNACSL